MWKDINGWEDLYAVNELGEIKNKLNNQLLVGDKNSEGYCRVSLQNTNHIPKQQRFFRHRLVAEHFIPNPLHLPEINHKDNNINNNTVSNLEWVSKKDNERYSHKYGLKEYKPFNVVFNNNTIKIYEFKQDLADELHVTRATIKNWLHKKNYGYKNYGIESIGYI